MSLVRRLIAAFLLTGAAALLLASSTLALERVGLIEAIARLPRRQREAISLRYLADLSEREVAAAMHTTVGSVKQHTYRALARLRVDLAPIVLATEADDA